jgi:hypothetical protein
MTDKSSNDNKLEAGKTAQLKSRLEIYNTIILSLATLAIAWCSYQSSLWSGVQTFKLAESNGYNRKAQQEAITSGQRRVMDEQIIIQFVEDFVARNVEKTGFYMNRIRPELSNVLRKWAASNPINDTTAPAHPMVTKEYLEIVRNELKVSEELSRLGQECMDAAQSANNVSDRYTRLTVIFSMIMFLGAITQKIKNVKLSRIITIASMIILVVALLVLFTSMPFASKH